MMIGFFEGLDSERGIAWRLADSLTLREFLSIGLEEKTPDHVTISRTRRLIDAETHQRIFTWVLERLARGGLIKGKTIGVDSTTLEANAAMKSIVRRDTGESYTAYLKRLAAAEGMETKDAAALLRMDRKRTKRTSNEDWESPSDSEAQITKLKDGRTVLAYKAENAVDLETGAIVAVTTHGGAAADTTTVPETVIEAGIAVAGLIAEQTPEGKYEVPPLGFEEVVADKGYPSNDVAVISRKWACGATLPSLIVALATGMAKRQRRRPSMATGFASRESAASAYSGNVASASNATSRIRSIPEGWTGCAYEAWITFIKSSSPTVNFLNPNF